ncbi:MAG: hypothetical protein EOP62_04095 [Sphingomonadales bacterium]|nr:MAG: hypothetical protein EOP62_04095 [Sphingomonadales bacterium]
MSFSLLALRRLKVLSHGRDVYDECFHLGVNIIRGENGSGKSTIADFIFYVFGGEFDDWKDRARQCDEVRAEIQTASATLTLRRRVGTKQEPITVFYGRLEDAEKSPLEGWERYPIRRQTEKQLGFSQMLFRACGIPEAPSDEGSNVTAHQIMRLLYSDQRTPAPRLFRFERFDTRDIRAAVGDLLLGANSYALYEAQVELRTAAKLLEDRQQRLRSLLEAIPSDYGSMNTGELGARIVALSKEADQLVEQIGNLDEDEPEVAEKEFQDRRTDAVKELRGQRTSLRRLEEQSERLGLEITDLDVFVDYLEETMGKVNAASSIADALGAIDFAYCPACLKPLDGERESGRCVVCTKPVDPERESARYLEIKLDISLQLRESRQILEGKELELQKTGQELRSARQAMTKRSIAFQSEFELAASPREARLAGLNQRIGEIGQQIAYLGSVRELAEKVAKLIAERDDAQKSVDVVTARIDSLRMASGGRVTQAMGLVGTMTKELLKQDLKRQEEFADPRQVTVDFEDDAILVDGKLNFAESSNVVLKNAVILALLGAAASDEKFYHPRFLLMDNVEDKGMEQVRSYNFQKMIVELSKQVHLTHQIIFTTSMPNPALDLEHLAIGPHYTEHYRTLNFDDRPYPGDDPHPDNEL